MQPGSQVRLSVKSAWPWRYHDESSTITEILLAYGAHQIKDENPHQARNLFHDGTKSDACSCRSSFSPPRWSKSTCPRSTLCVVTFLRAPMLWSSRTDCSSVPPGYVALLYCCASGFLVFFCIGAYSPSPWTAARMTHSSSWYAIWYHFFSPWKMFVDESVFKRTKYLALNLRQPCLMFGGS